MDQDGARSERTLGIVFFDLMRFARWGETRRDPDVAAFLQHFYERSADILEPAGLRLVKFMGDAGLAVCDPERLLDAVEALRLLRESVAADEDAHPMDLAVKVHVGSVVEGTFGPARLARYDVMGQAVNTAALLPGGGIVLSEAAHARLETSARDGFVADEAQGVWRQA